MLVALTLKLLSLSMCFTKYVPFFAGKETDVEVLDTLVKVCEPIQVAPVKSVLCLISVSLRSRSGGLAQVKVKDFPLILTARSSQFDGGSVAPITKCCAVT